MKLNRHFSLKYFVVGANSSFDDIDVSAYLESMLKQDEAKEEQQKVFAGRSTQQGDERMENFKRNIKDYFPTCYILNKRKDILITKSSTNERKDKAHSDPKVIIDRSQEDIEINS